MYLFGSQMVTKQTISPLVVSVYELLTPCAREGSGGGNVNANLELFGCNLFLLWRCFSARLGVLEPPESDRTPSLDRRRQQQHQEQPAETGHLITLPSSPQS